jgi:hypothetical protein
MAPGEQACTATGKQHTVKLRRHHEKQVQSPNSLL